MTSEFQGQTCGIYPRVSSRPQATRDKTSLDDQIEACKAYAREVGMTVDALCVRREAYTSRVMSRPELNQLLADMKARRVRNLLIDRADRLSRAGQLAALTFLQQFIKAGITLHVVGMGEGEDGDDRALVVRTDKDVKDFLDAAYEAQQENKKRIRIIRRAKRSRAAAGVYLRGNCAPFGYRYEPSEWDAHGNVTARRMLPDARDWATLGYPAALAFAPHPYATRQGMCRLYADGLSFKAIANRLTAAGVPTPAQVLERPRASALWQRETVKFLVLNPLNEGVLTNFRATYELCGPDKTHESDWVKVTPLRRDQQMVVTPPDGGPAPVVDAATLARIAARGSVLSPTPLRDGRYANRALLAYGMGTCGHAGCGGSVAVKVFTRHGKQYAYYYCSKQARTEALHPMWTLAVSLVDPAAWFEVERALVSLGEGNDNYLDTLAETQAQADTQAAAGGLLPTLDGLRLARARFLRDVDTLALELARAQSQTARDAIQRQLDRLEPEIQQADARIAAYERQASHLAARRAVLADTLAQYRRYSDLLLAIDPYQPRHYPAMRAVLTAVGARFTLTKDAATGEPEMAVSLTITPSAAAPWFSEGDAPAGAGAEGIEGTAESLMPPAAGGAGESQAVSELASWSRRP